VQRLGVRRRVAVQDVAVLDGERFPRPLVFGEVPARGELRLQRLRGRSETREALVKTRRLKGCLKVLYVRITDSLSLLPPFGR